MVAFYVWPVLAVGLVAAARAGRWRLVAASGLAVFTTVLSNWRLGEFPWWSSVTVCLLLVLAAGMTCWVSRPPAEVSMIGYGAVKIPRMEARSGQLTGATR
jgi:hypothetical protein